MIIVTIYEETARKYIQRDEKIKVCIVKELKMDPYYPKHNATMSIFIAILLLQLFAFYVAEIRTPTFKRSNFIVIGNIIRFLIIYHRDITRERPIQ